MVGSVVALVTVVVLAWSAAVNGAGAAARPQDDPPPVASAAGGVGDRASGYFKFPPASEGGGRVFIYVEVAQGTNTSGQEAEVLMGIGTCVTREAEDGRRYDACRGGGFAHPLALGEFEASPLLDAARLDFSDPKGRFFKGGEERQSVAWKAFDQLPTPTPAYGLGNRTAVAGLKTGRTAGAAGRVFGFDLAGANEITASISRGGAVGVVGPPESTTVTLPGGAVVTRTVDRRGRLELTMRTPFP